jgi:hypothetical protein
MVKEQEEKEVDHWDVVNTKCIHNATVQNLVFVVRFSLGASLQDHTNECGSNWFFVFMLSNTLL